MKSLFYLTLGVLAAGVLAAQNTENLSILPSDHPAIQYQKTALHDPVALLDQKLGSSQAKLEFRDGPLGYLPSILKNLGVNPDSQMLVFSKTSFQAPKISPRAPRAIFFSDDVMVGSVQDSDLLEFASLDPQQGMIFYTLDVHQSDHPRFDRRDVCLQCHQGPATAGVPGIMIASVYPDGAGMPAFNSGMPVTDHRTPFQDRWGGWFVSGTGEMRHKGNAVARDRSKPDVLSKLTLKIDPAGYLSTTSDIVALMTIEHQTRMTNLMIRAGWEARMGVPADSSIDALVTYMLFADEAQLFDPVQGVSTFTKTFAQRGPRDKQGRSLRDFDLKSRLFRYPLSYMVYSDVFAAMPEAVRNRVYQRLYDVLSGKDQDKKFARLAAEDRKAALEILRDTQKGLPAYWR